MPRAGHFVPITGAVVLAAVLGACQIGADHCDPTGTDIALRVPGGRESLASFVLSGSCVASGDSTDCHVDP